MVNPEQSLCYFLAGIVTTLIGVWFTHVKNAVTRKDLMEIIDHNNRQFFGALKANQAILGDLFKEVTVLKSVTAVLADRAKVPMPGGMQT